MTRAIALALCLVGCIPTLSAEHGDAYLAATARADRARLAGHDREAARAWLEAAAHAERPKDRAEATVRAARATAAFGDVDGALVLYARVYDSRPPTEQASGALVEAARLHMGRGELEPARALLLRTILEHPNDAAASRAVADLLALPTPPSLDALQALYARVGQHDVGEPLSLAIAEAAVAAGDDRSARAALQRCLHDHPYPRGSRVDDVALRLATLDEADGDPHAAAADLEELAQLHEHSSFLGSYTLTQMPAAELRLARLYRDALADPTRAAATYDRLRGSYPTSVFVDDSLYEEGAMWIAHGEVPRGCELLQRAVATHGGHATRLAETMSGERCGVTAGSAGAATN